MIVARNAKGKVTISFPKGLTLGDREGVVVALDKALKDLG
jgi:hypothetical protein